MTSSAPPNRDPLLEPAAPESRFVNLDILRGFALLGILSANLPIFSLFYSLYEPFSFPGLSGADRAAEWFVRTFAEGSFYPIFSFLFGLGFALQLRKGAGALPVFRRRLLILLGIGLVHAVLIWYGDILVSYALLGFVLILFRNRKDRTLLVWVALSLVYAFGVLFGVANLDPQVAFPAEQQAAVSALMQGSSYGELVRFHLGWLGLNLVNVLVLGFQILGFFLLGLLVGRRGVVQDPPAHRPLLRRVLGACLLLAAPVAVHAVLLWRGESPALLRAYDLAVGSPALGFAYASGLLLLLGSKGWQGRLQPLAAVGRTALSNYLLQSLVGVALFYPYGLGLFGQVGPAWGLALTALIFAAQVVLSNLWLRRYRFGPAEWVWRALTYRTRPAMRLSQDRA